MLTPEKTLKFELVRILLSAGVSPDSVKEKAIHLFEWISENYHEPLASIGDKEQSNNL